MGTKNLTKIAGLAIGIAVLPCMLSAQSVVKTIQGPSDTPNYAAIQPFWVNTPTIEVLGRAKINFVANNAKMEFSVYEIDKDPDKALLKVSQRSKPAIDNVIKILNGKGRIDVNYVRREIYAQYKNAKGEMVENDREDKIENYIVGWEIKVEVNDFTLIPKIRSELLAIENAKMRDNVNYSFSSSAEQERDLFALAIKDGKERAKIIADAHGLKLNLLTVQEYSKECLSTPSGYGTSPEKNTKPSFSYSEQDDIITVTGSRIKPKPADLLMPAFPETFERVSIVCLSYAIEK